MSHSSSTIGNQGLLTLNGHVLCAIDCETTGLTAGYHDIIEFACQPLNADLRPMPGVIPFVTLIRPKERYSDSCDPEAMKINGINMADVKLYGSEPWRAADLFTTWFEQLNLAPYKKIAPLGKNFDRFDKGFMEDWLGPKTFNLLVWHRSRDLGPVVQYINDKAEFEGRKPPFPQTGLGDVRSYLKIPPRQAHRALDDALTTAECYRAIVKGDIPDPDDR